MPPSSYATFPWDEQEGFSWIAQWMESCGTEGHPGGSAGGVTESWQPPTTTMKLIAVSGMQNRRCQRWVTTALPQHQAVRSETGWVGGAPHPIYECS